MVSKKAEKQQAALRKRLNAAMADFSPPTLEEMLGIGHSAFNPRRLPAKPQQGRTGTARVRKRRITVFSNEDPSDEHTANQTLSELLSEIHRKRPRQGTDPDWTFAVGGKREYMAISTQGPNAFSAQYPVWRGQKFVGCVLTEIRWPIVRRVLEDFYAGSPVSNCFAGIEGALMPYTVAKKRRK